MSKGSCPCEWTEPCSRECACAAGAGLLLLRGDLPLSPCRRCCRHGNELWRQETANNILATERKVKRYEEALTAVIRAVNYSDETASADEARFIASKALNH